MRTSFEAEGEIRGTDLLAGLVGLWREGASGTLQFSRSGATAGFELAAGEIVGTSSSDPRFETAAILLRGGKIDEATLDRLAAPEGGDRALGALQAGILTKREWRWGEKIRAVEVLSDLLTWLEGDYWFFRTGGRESGEFRLTVPRLVLELFLRSRDRGLVLHYLGGVDVPLVRAAHFDNEFATFGLTADAESVVGLIDGESTAAEIASEAPAEAFAVEKLLAALVTLGLIHPEYAQADVATATGGPWPRPVPDEERDETQAEEATEQLVPPVESAESGGEQTREESQKREPDAPEVHALEPGGDRDAGVETESDEGGRGLLEDASLDVAGAEVAAEYGPGERDSGDFEAEPPLAAGFVEMEGGARGRAVFDRPLDMTTGAGEADRPRPRSGSSWVWVFAALAGIVGAVLYWKARGPAGPDAGSPLALAATPAATARAGAAAPLPSVASPAPALAGPSPAIRVPTPRPTAISTRVRSTALPTRTAVAAAPKRPPTRVQAAEGAPAAASRQWWLDRAARDHKRASADRRAHYAIQLELACEVDSLVDAWKHDRPAGTMWVLATPFQDKTCFRVLWGRYPTRQAARRALAGTPRFFATQRNRPVVVSVR